MAYVKFLKGTLAGYNAITNKSADNIYITTDEGGIYLGDKRLGDIVVKNTRNDLPAANSVSTSALYYIADINVLARSNGTSWVQVNAAGLTEISVQGSGNVLAGVEVVLDETTGAKKLSFTTASVATSEGMAALQKQVSDLDTAYKQADAGLAGDIAKAQKAAEDAQADADANAKAITDLDTDLQGQIDTINAAIGANGLAKDVADLKAADVTINGRIDDMDTAYKAADTALRKELTGYTAGNGAATGTYKTIKELSEHMAEAESDISTLEGAVEGHGTRLTEAEGDIKALEEAVGAGGAVEGKIETAVAALRKEILTDGAAGDNISDAYDTIQEIAAWLGDSQLGKDAGEIISELNTLSGTVGSASSGLVKDVADLKAADTTIRGEFAAADTALEKKLAAGTGGNSEFATGTYKNINALSAQMVTAEGNISDLQNDLDTLEGVVGDASSGLVKNVADLAAADTAIRGEFAQADTNLKAAIVSGTAGTGTYKNLNDLSAHMVTAEGDIDTLEGNFNTLNGTVGGHTTQLTNIENQLTWGEF